MRKLAWTLPVILGLSGCFSSAGADGKWKQHTQGLPFVMGYQQGLADAKKSGKPVMFFVTTTWCGWCKKLANDSFNDPAIRKVLEKFVLVIVDGDTESKHARSLGARGYPHVVFQSKSGRTLATVRGYRPPADFRKIAQKALRASR